MALAGRFARMVYEPYWHSQEAKRRDGRLPSPALVVETLRIAGLLHDVGHGPLSHLLDRYVLEPRFGLTHESLSAHIIRTCLNDTIRRIRRTPDGDRLGEDETIDPEVVANIVQTGGEKALDALWKTLSLIIRGPYDADKMDFVLRDGAACGLEGIDPHEVERLILTSFIAPGPSGSPLMLLDSSSLIPLLAFLRQRQYLLQAVYYHRTVRALEAAIREPLIWASQSILKESPLKDLDSYFRFDEYSLHAALSQSLSYADPLARQHSSQWTDSMARRVIWKQVYEYVKRERELPPAFYPDPRRILRLMLESPDLAPHCATVPELRDRILVDVPVANMPKEVLDRPVLMYDRRSRQVTQLKPHELEDGGVFPHLVHYRIYVDRDYARYEGDVASAARRVLQGITTDSTSF